MTALPAGMKVWIAGGVTDMRQGMNALALQLQEVWGAIRMQARSSVSGAAGGDLVNLLWHDGVGMSLCAKRLETEERNTDRQALRHPRVAGAWLPPIELSANSTNRKAA